MSKLSRSLLLALLMITVFGAVPALAQEEDTAEDEGRFGSLFAEASVWVAQVNGTGFAPATELSSGISTLISPEDATETEDRYRVGYKLANGAGSVVATWYGHSQEWALGRSEPGQFIFGETLAFPTFAGFASDGRADGFAAVGSTSLKDLRIDFYRTAFQNRRVRGDWFVGLRRVDHKRSQSAEYFATLPPLPAYLPTGPADPPQPLPFSDLANVRSSFSGRGLEAGMEVQMPVFKDRVSIEGGFAIAVMRGDVDTFYSATNHVYTLDDLILLPVDYDLVLGDPLLLTGVDSVAATAALRSVSESGSSDVIETHLGVRYNVWRKLEIFAGFRTARYTNVGVDLRPVVGSETIFDLNAQTVSEVQRDAFYEGFYGGVAYAF